MAVIVNVAGKWDGRDIDKARKQLETLGHGAEASGKKASSSFSKIGGDLKSLVAIGGAAAGVMWFKSAIDSAGELQDTVSAAGMVFGNEQKKIVDFGKNAAESMGLSENAAIKAATSFAVFGKAAGLSGSEAAGFSTTLTQLAGDMASFYGGTVEDAVGAIGSALRGEQEPIRRYNVLLDDATLRQEAMRLGLIKTTKDALTPQQKVLAANAAILKQTTLVQGDYNRTASQFSNVQRTALAEWENTTTAIGSAFLPAATQAMQTSRGLLGVFNDIPAPVKAVAAALTLSSVAARLLEKPLSSINETAAKSPGFLRSLGDSWRYVGTQAAMSGVQYETTGQKLKALNTHMRLSSQASGLMKSAGSGLMGMLGGPWGLAIGGATLAVTAYMNAQQNAKEAADALSATLDKQSGAATVETYKQIATALQGDITSAKEWEALNERGLGLDRVTYAVATGGEALRSLQADIDKTAGGMDDTALIAGALGSAIQNQRSDLAAGSDAWRANQAAVSAGEMAQASATPPVDTLTTSVKTQADRIRELDLAWKRLNGLLGKQEAQDAAIKASQALAASLKENGSQFDGNSTKALANRDALRAAVSATMEHVTAMGKGPAAAKAYDTDVARLRATLAKSKLSPAEQAALLKPLIDMKTKVDILKTAVKNPLPLIIVPKIQGQGIITVHPGGKGTAVIDVRANGGRVEAGVPYRVNERGIETFIPDRPGMVANATQTRGNASGAQSITVNMPVTINGGGDALLVRRELDRFVAKLTRELKAGKK